MDIDLKLREGRSCKVTEGVKFKCDHKKKKLKNIPGFTRKNKKNGQSSWYITINIATQPSSHATLGFF